MPDFSFVVAVAFPAIAFAILRDERNQPEPA